jgi:hypothetical protein
MVLTDIRRVKLVVKVRLYPDATQDTFDGDLHVQGYPTASEGAQATALTLEGGYPLIVAALRSGAGICGGGFASELGRWSGGGYQEVC